MVLVPKHRESQGTEVLQKQVWSTSGEFFSRNHSGGDSDRLDPVFLCRFHVVRMVADEGYAGSAMDEPFAPRLLQSDTNQSRAAGSHFSESAELKELLQAGVFHFLPSDAGQISGDQSNRNGTPVQPSKQHSGSRTNLAFQVWTGPHIDILGVPDDFGHLFANHSAAGAGVSQHDCQNIAVQHSLCRNLVVVSFDSRSAQDCGHQGLPVMRTGFAYQGAIDVKQNQYVGGRHSPLLYLHGY